MKKRLLLLPLLFITTGCIPVSTTTKINCNAEDVSFIKIYNLENIDINEHDIDEFTTRYLVGEINPSYHQTLLDSIEGTKYKELIPLAPSTPNFYFYGYSIYIQYEDNQKAILCPNLAVKYDAEGNWDRAFRGHNEELELIIQESLNYLI